MKWEIFLRHETRVVYGKVVRDSMYGHYSTDILPAHLISHSPLGVILVPKSN